MNEQIRMNVNYARALCLLLFLLPCTLNAFAGWKCVREKDEFGHTFEGGITRSKEGYTLSLYRVDGSKFLSFFLDMDKSHKWFKTGKEFPAEVSLFIDGEWKPMQTTWSFLYGLYFTGTSSHSAELQVSISSSDAAFYLKATKMSIKVKCLDDNDYTMRFDISGIKKVYDFVGLDVEYPPSLEHLSSKQQTYDFDKGNFSYSETWKVTSDNDGNLITVQGTIGNEAAFALCVSNDVIDNGFPSLSETEKRDMLRQYVGETSFSIENPTYSYTKFKDETAIRITGTMNGLYADMVVTILQHRFVAYARLADSKAKLSHKAFNTISQTFSVTPFIVNKNKVYSDLANDAQFLGNGSSLNAYIARNLQYPASVRTNGVHSSATCSFIVECDGSISQVEIISSSNNKELDNEAIRVVRSMPRWQPATYVGEAVRTRKQVKVTLDLNPAITLSKDQLHFSSAGGTQTITVNSEENWKYHISPYARFHILRSGQQLKVSCSPRERGDYTISKEVLIISTSDGICKYKVQLSQDNYPRPQINLSTTNVRFEDRESSQVIQVSSNRNWGYSHPSNKAFNVSMSDDSTSLVINASRNFSRKERNDNIEVFTDDPQLGRETSRNVYIYQSGRQPSHFRENCSSFIDTYGKVAFNIVKADVAIGTDMEDLYLPISLEMCAVRFSIVELSLLRFRFENILTDGGLDGVLWEPQVRVIFPIKDSWAIVPIIGPSAHLKEKDNDQLSYDPTWGFSAYLGARKYWGKGLIHSDFYLGYQYGYYNGVVLGATIGCDLSW